MEKKGKHLTIMITTFNRRERLLRTLHQIEQQGYFEQYCILISDNCSDYDVKDMLDKEFEPPFRNLITVHRWNFNIGHSSNISVSFALVDTAWCLYLSDDDILLPGAIKRICEDINKNPDAIALKYSLKGRNPYPDRVLSTIDDFISLYEGIPSQIDEMYYLVRAYHLSRLKDCRIYYTDYSYTYISYLIPLLFGLKMEYGYVKTSSFNLIEYDVCPPGENWYYNDRYIRTFLGIYSFTDLLLSEDKKTRNRLMKLVMSYLKISYAIECLRHSVSKGDREWLYQKIYSAYCIAHPVMRFFPKKITWYIVILRRSFSLLLSRVKNINRCANVF